MNSIPIFSISQDMLNKSLAEMSDFERVWVQENGFKAALEEILLIPDSNGKLAKILFGLGDKHARTRTRLSHGVLAQKLPKGLYHLENAPDLNLEIAALAFDLGAYEFDQYKKNKRNFAKLAPISGAHHKPIVKAAHMVMDLINEPANVMTPKALSKAAQDLARDFGGDFSKTKGMALLEAGFPLIHAVGRAGFYEPRLLDLRFGDPKHPKLTLVGKGVCFDTGGLDIKPSASMGLMKKDMGGAAHALGLARMILERKLPISLRVLIPAVENAISANAMRPGDILVARDGQTVEVNNTDAEGRLVLADALACASEEKTDLIISLATLTGAARVALGPDLVPFYTDEEALAAQLGASADRVFDPLWRMPFWAPYENMIEPQNAMLDNAPSGGMAGSITAALFLRRFVKEANYLHLDLYAWTPKPLPGRPFGAAVQGIRAILDTLEQRYGK